MKNICFTILFMICFLLQGMAQTVTITTNSLSVCPNEVVAFGYIETGLTEPVSCLWDLGDGIISTNCSPSNTYYPGTYTICVTVTDANSVGIQDCETLTVAEEITYSSSITDISCFDDNDGSIVCFPPLGSNYMFEWSNGATTESINNLSAGVYEVTVTDALGCQVTDQFVISEPTSMALNLQITNPTDCASNDGGISAISLGGGTAPYTYEWSTGQNTAVITGLAAATSYSVTITDANGCTFSEATVVTINETPVATINSITPATCDLADGGVELLPSSYDYTWADGATGSIRTDLVSGIYAVTVTNPVNPNCLSVIDVEIPEINSLTLTITDITNPTCGEANGSVTATVTNGSGNYAYLWTTGATSATQTGLPVGTYQVTVTDLMTGCETVESFDLIEEEVTDVYFIFLLGVSYICEDATDGWLDYSTEPSEGITTTISDANGNIHANGTLQGGVTYTIRAYDENGCLAAEDSSGLTNYGTMVIDLQATNPTACGVFDGFIDAAVSGGGSSLNPYTYVWNNGMSTEDITGLNAGTYTVTVTSYLGCIGTQEISLEDQEVVTPAESTIILCPGETALLETAVDGSTYLWSEGSITQSIDTDVVGTYAVTITNASNCTGIQSFIVEAANDCVWSGDANYDGLANNQDVLFLGMAYGNTGQSRINPNINWEGQLAPFEWDSTFSNGINQKHADSDGNGIVEQDDTLAIVQNYNLPAHALKETNGEGDNILHVDFNSSSADYEQYVELEINLADLEQTVPEAYGLAFSLVFNYPEVIKPESIQVDFGNSAFGPFSETINLFKFLGEEGRMDFAVTRFDHVGLTDLQGEVVKVRFIIEDNIDGFAPTDNYILNASLTDIYCVKAFGEEVILTATSSELTMLSSNSITDLTEIEDALDYYPNPTQETLYLNMKGNSTISQVKIFDMLGRWIGEEKADDIQEVKTNHWEAGMYFLEVTDSKNRQYLLRIIKE